jgi:6-phosphogluconolactonase
MSSPVWTLHDDANAMAEAVASRIESVIRDALVLRGRALLALPGGKSPVPTFERLAHRPINWPRVTILPTDDRVVAGSDPLSNKALLARYFGDCGARLLWLHDGAATDYRASGNTADVLLRALPWPPDLIWLGVGTDGHTASIFPGPNLQEALDGMATRRAIGVLPEPLPPEAPVARVTLTRAAIASCRRLLLTLSGDAKRAVVERALESRAPRTSPVARVLACARMPVEIHWSPA